MSVQDLGASSNLTTGFRTAFFPSYLLNHHPFFQSLQYVLHCINPHFDIFHLRGKAQLIRAGKSIFFVVLNQQDDFGWIDIVVFAKGYRYRFAGRINGFDTQFFCHKP